MAWVHPPSLELSKAASEAERVPTHLLNQIFLECVTCHQW